MSDASKTTDLKTIREVLESIKEMIGSMEESIDKMVQKKLQLLDVENEETARRGLTYLRRYVNSVHEHVTTPSLVKLTKKDASQAFVDQAERQIAEKNASGGPRKGAAKGK